MIAQPDGTLWRMDNIAQLEPGGLSTAGLQQPAQAVWQRAARLGALSFGARLSESVLVSPEASSRVRIASEKTQDKLPHPGNHLNRQAAQFLHSLFFPLISGHHEPVGYSFTIHPIPSFLFSFCLPSVSFSC